MLVFQKKLLVLAGASLAFAGVAFGQATCVTNLPSVPVVRAEGLTEQVADVVLTCTAPAGGVVASAGTPAAPHAAVTLFVDHAVTSRLLQTAAPPAVQWTEAVAIVAPAPAAPLTAITQGVITPAGVTFTGIATPALAAGASYTITFTNTRVNATGGTSTVNAQPFITGSVLLNPSALAPLNVATVTNGLTAATFSTDFANTLRVPAAGVSNLVCAALAAQAVPGTGSGIGITPKLWVHTGENFQTAFKTNVAAAGNGTPNNWFVGNSETGFTTVFPSTGGVNTANSGTRIKLVFNNVPVGMSIYLQNAVGSDVAGGGVVLNSSETGALSGVPTVTASGAFSGFTGPTANVNGPWAISLVGTAAAGSTSFSAIYEVVAQSPVATEAFSFPVYLVAAANTLGAAITTPATPMTITTSFAPVVALPLTGPVANIPSFTSTSTAVNAAVENLCLTTLLFPYVTNSPGYETGIAISNTTTDNLGAVTTAAPNGLSSAVPSTGTCAVNFYGGTSAQAAPFVTPLIGPNSTATPTGGVTYANTLTGMGPSNFTGYAIAKCNFLDGHGFSYIVQNYGTPGGTAMGYLALVIPNVRPTAGEGAVGQ